MKRRVSLPVELFDGHALPGASCGGTYLGDLGNPVLTHKPAAAGDAIQVLSSKWVSSPGRNVKRGIKPSASKASANGEVG